MQENVYIDPFAAECNQYARKFDDALNAKNWVTTEHLIAESEGFIVYGTEIQDFIKSLATHDPAGMIQKKL